jgi:hypothetical protein
MVLDLTRELDEWQTYLSPREARAAMRRQYDEDRWFGRRYFPILIVEHIGARVPAARAQVADATCIIAWLWLSQAAT